MRSSEHDVLIEQPEAAAVHEQRTFLLAKQFIKDCTAPGGAQSSSLHSGQGKEIQMLFADVCNTPVSPEVVTSLLISPKQDLKD